MERSAKCELPRKIKVICQLALLLAFFALSINVSAQSSMSNTGFEKPVADLSKDELDQKDLEAYQNRALQKVEEYFQYLEAMADSQHEDAVRDKALEMALRQFEDEATIRSADTTRSIHSYLVGCRNSTQFKSPERIDIDQALTGQPEGHYLGKIQVLYSQRDSRKKGKDSGTSHEAITVILKKSKKDFGDAQLHVWEIYLSNIE